MDNNLYEYDEPYSCTCFDLTKTSSQQRPYLINQPHRLNEKKKSGSSHDGRYPNQNDKNSRSLKQKKSLKHKKPGTPKQRSSLERELPSAPIQIIGGINKNNKIDNYEKMAWGQIPTISQASNHIENNSENKRKIKYRFGAPNQAYEPILFDGKLEVNYPGMNEPTIIHQPVPDIKKIETIINHKQPKEPIPYKPSHQQLQHNPQPHRQTHSSRISLAQFKSSQYQNQSHSKRTSQYSQHRDLKGDVQQRYEPKIQSFKLHMKEIESIVDQQEFDDQISEVIGHGWQYNRQSQFFDCQSAQQAKQKLLTLPTLASNIKNSGTTNSVLGIGQSNHKRL